MTVPDDERVHGHMSTASDNSPHHWGKKEPWIHVVKAVAHTQ